MENLSMREAIWALCAFASMTAAQAQEIEAEGELLNLIEVFAGITVEDSESEISLGATYERRFSDRFGMGVIGEFTEGREIILAVPFFWHPVEPWRFLIAPGTEMEDGDHEFLVRVGGSYEFEFSGWSLSPEINLDSVDSDVVVVIGASIGWKF